MADDVYLIWSNEHRGWWKPGGYGYARGIGYAGRFSRDNALRICRDAIPQAGHIGMISEIPVRLTDVSDFIAGQLCPEEILT